VESLRFLKIPTRSLGPPPYLFFLWRSSVPLLRRSLLFPATPRHLLLHFTPRVAPSSSAALAPSLLGLPAHATPLCSRPSAARRLCRRHLTAAVPRARVCSYSLPLLRSSTSRPNSIHFPSFPLPRAPRAPNATAALFLHSGEPLSAMGRCLQLHFVHNNTLSSCSVADLSFSAPPRHQTSIGTTLPQSLPPPPPLSTSASPFPWLLVSINPRTPFLASC
jgi:hypothetical protein